jgi:poly(hydroxyalkanoate) depolymerase family esterase
MNPLIQRLMSDAARMTQDGQLQAATEAIQRALRSGAVPMQNAPPFPTPGAGGSFDAMAQFESFLQRTGGSAAAAAATSTAPTASPAARANASVVLDGCVRVVDEASPAPAVATRPTAPTSAADGQARPERWTDGSFTHQGRTLAYKLFVPARDAQAVAAPRPLVLMLHGCTQDPADFAAGTRMNELARKAGVIVVYPAQTQHANSQKCWNWFKSQHQQRGRGEPALLAALVQSIAAAEHADPERLYAAGLSAGGAMADILGRLYPDVFAAVGVHSGLPAGSATDLMSAMAAMRGAGAGGGLPGMPAAASAGPAAGLPRHGSRAAPVIVFHGDADATVHPGNAAGVVRAALEGRGNGAGGPAAPRVAEGRSAKGQSFTRTEHPGADGRSAVELWLLRGAGHAWSGGSASGSYTDPRGADASAEMLRFFLDHPLTPA